LFPLRFCPENINTVIFVPRKILLTCFSKNNNPTEMFLDNFHYNVSAVIFHFQSWKGSLELLLKYILTHLMQTTLLSHTSIVKIEVSNYTILELPLNYNRIDVNHMTIVAKLMSALYTSHKSLFKLKFLVNKNGKLWYCPWKKL
jgi:hypothetical protein